MTDLIAMPRTIETQASPIEGLRRRVEDWAADCWDDNAPTRELAFVDGSTIRYRAQAGQAEALFNVEEGTAVIQAAVSQHAFLQLAERLDAPPIRWLADQRHVEPGLRAKVMNLVLAERPNATLLLRHKADVLRAALSDQYSVFNHTDVVDLLAGALDQLGDVGAGARVHRAEVGDELRAYVLLPHVTVAPDPTRGGERLLPGPDGGQPQGPAGHQWRGGGPDGNGGLHPGIYVTNSEVGTGKVRIHGGIFRAVCDNGVILGWKADEGLDLVHRNLSRRTIGSAFADAVGRALRLSEQAIGRFVETTGIMLEPTALSGLAREWGDRYGITLPNIEAWTKMVTVEASANGRPGTPALFDFLNAATYTAQGLHPEEREQMERMAGDGIYAEVPARYLYRG